MKNELITSAYFDQPDYEALLARGCGSVGVFNFQIRIITLIMLLFKERTFLVGVIFNTVPQKLFPVLILSTQHLLIFLMNFQNSCARM